MIEDSRRGFTLVEGVIAIVLLLALMAILIPVLREREGQRLQGLAETAPWEVFEFRAAPAKESFAAGEGIVIRCELENLTNQSLQIHFMGRSFVFAFADTRYFAGVSRNELEAPPRTAIAPKKTITFDLVFDAVGVGATEVRLVEWREQAMMIRGYLVETPRGLLPPEEASISGILAGANNLLQSNAFRLVVKPVADTQSPTFDEIIADIEREQRDRERVKEEKDPSE